MVRRQRVSGPAAWALVLAVAVVSSATCLTAADMTPAQRACCAAMAHDCGEVAIEQGCCAGEGAGAQNVAPAAVVDSVAPPPAVLVAVLEPPAPAASLTRGFNDADGGMVKPPGAPPYILASALRI